jgi:hypothetical protein
MNGLLDFITDPQIQQQIAERRSLVERIAEHMGCPLEEARRIVDDGDAMAAATFCIGNTVPRNILH